MFGKEGDFLRSPTIVIALLDRDLWKEYKIIFDKYGILSQVIRKSTAESDRFLMKASSILKQINSKVGGDLYYLKFPAQIQEKLTMVIGIDVCHSGSRSVVGFTASVNREMSQYFRAYFYQPKH